MTFAIRTRTTTNTITSKISRKNNWMSRIDRAVGRVCLATLVTVGASTRVSAELIEDLTVVSPKALALANAVTADPPGIDFIHFNAAGLIDITHSIPEVKLAAFQQANNAE